MNRDERSGEPRRISAAAGWARGQRLLVFAAAATLSVALLAGCGDAGDGEPPAPAVLDEDVSPLSREDLELQAEAMSPAVAESLGIVDTTISVTRPVPPESVLLPGTPFDSIPEF